MAYGVVVRSPHGHAKILSIDTVAAKAAPGVLAVITAADWKAAKLGDLPSHSGLKRRDGSPMLKPRYPVLAEDRVRWVGDPVAFVVADTPAQALDAAELVAGRLRAAARRRLDRRGGRSRARRASRTSAPTISASSS